MQCMSSAETIIILMHKFQVTETLQLSFYVFINLPLRVSASANNPELGYFFADAIPDLCHMLLRASAAGVL